MKLRNRLLVMTLLVLFTLGAIGSQLLAQQERHMDGNTHNSGWCCAA